MTAAEISDALLEAALILYVGATAAFIAEILFAGRRSERPARQLVAAGGVPDSDASAEAPPTVTDRWAERGERAGRAGLALLTIAAAFQLGSVIARGVAAGRAPWGNMFEFAVVGSLVAVIVFLVLQRRYDVRYLGVWVSTFAVLILGVAVLFLATPAAPVMPALRSTWLVIHVLAATVATGLFVVGGILAALYLVKARSAGSSEGGALSRYVQRLPGADTLDRLSFRVHAVAFPIYTFAVLIAGPIWAQYAWSRYWGWDPKETWAFITWVVYAAYLHARVTAGWRGKKAAILALVGFGTLLFNFVGVNLLFSGLHSYAGM